MMCLVGQSSCRNWKWVHATDLLLTGMLPADGKEKTSETGP